MTVILIDRHNKKIKTWAKPLVTIVTRWAILPIHALSPASQKTSISLCDFLSVTGASTKALKVRVLDRIFCICYFVKLYKDNGKDVLALLDSGSEVNAMTPAYVVHLGFKMRVTDVGTQKIDKSLLAIYSMVIAAF